jgi:hypothetical protein
LHEVLLEQFIASHKKRKRRAQALLTTSASALSRLS